MESEKRLQQWIDDTGTLGSKEHSMTVKRTSVTREAILSIVEELSRFRVDLGNLWRRIDVHDKDIASSAANSESTLHGLDGLRKDFQRMQNDMADKFLRREGHILGGRLDSLEKTLQDHDVKVQKEIAAAQDRPNLEKVRAVVDEILRPMTAKQAEKAANDLQVNRVGLEKLIADVERQTKQAAEEAQRAQMRANAIDGKLDKHASKHEIDMKDIVVDVRKALGNVDARGSEDLKDLAQKLLQLKDAHADHRDQQKLHLDELEKLKNSHLAHLGDFRKQQAEYNAARNDSSLRQVVEAMAEVLGLPVGYLASKGTASDLGASAAVDMMGRAPAESVLGRLKGVEAGHSRRRDDVDGIKRLVDLITKDLRTLADAIGAPVDDNIGLEVRCEAPRTLWSRIDEIERLLGVTASKTQEDLALIRNALDNAVQLHQNGVRPDQYNKLKQCVDRVMNLLFDSASSHAKDMQALKEANR